MESGFWSSVAASWAGPAGMMIFFGGVVWGIQLNINAIVMNRRQARLEDDLRNVTRQLAEVSKNSLRTNLILEGLEKDLMEHGKHNEKARNSEDDIKTRLVKLEERCKHINPTS